MNHENLEIIRSKRGGRLLLYEGYSYNFHKEKERFTYWRCKDRKCPGNMILDDMMRINSQKPHNHEENFTRNENLFFKEVMKNRAVETKDTARDIITEGLKYISDENIIQLPKYKSLQHMINKERKKNFIRLDKDTDIPESIKYTIKKEHFYLYDSGIEDKNRIICFSTKTNILHLSNCDTWIADGTFKSCPLNFYQIYTILGIFHGKTLPLCYFLMKNKSLMAYDKAFMYLRSSCNSQPKLIVIDFEQAAYLAFRKNFPASIINGCFFHFTQSIYKRILQNSLSQKYINDSSFRLDIKMIMSFAFLKPKDIKIGIEIYEKYIIERENYQNIKIIWNWFKENYLKNEDKESNTVFDVKFWSCHERVLSSFPVTTNAIEGWHRSLNNHFRIPHPSIELLIEELKKEQARIEYEIIKLIYENYNSNESHSEKNKYHDIIEKYPNMNLFDFLKQISTIFEIKIK